MSGAEDATWGVDDATPGVGGGGEAVSRGGPGSGNRRPRDIERALKLWVVLSRAQAAVEEHARADIEARGLTPGEFAVLEALYHKGPLLMGEIQRKVLVSSGGITYLVDRLVERGLVRREECPEDRRASYAVLTEEGRERIGTIFPGHAHSIGRAVSKLDAREQEEAIRLLRKLGRGAAALGP